MGASISSVFCRSERNSRLYDTQPCNLIDPESQSIYDPIAEKSQRNDLTKQDVTTQDNSVDVITLSTIQSTSNPSAHQHTTEMNDDSIPLSAYKCDCYHAPQPPPSLTHDELRQHMGSDITAPQKLEMHIIPTLCNTVILWDEHKDAVIIDPGAYADKIWEVVTEHQLNVKQILITHAHFDHVLAAAQLREISGAKIYLHAGDRVLWQFIPIQISQLKLQLPSDFTLGQPDHLLREGDAVALGGTVIHTPGHTEGSVSFYFPKARMLFPGDTLFRGNIGRSDLMGGNFDALKASLIHKLYVLPESTNVYPGHGPMTVIGYEKWNNAVVKMPS